MLDILIAGGGAAGFFTAIQCKLQNPGLKVSVYESQRDVLRKVRISGGRRCNVTHACYEPSELVKNYPRGGRELLGPFNKFGPAETELFFEQRGIFLKTESDGRMFPVSDSSSDIIGCFLNACLEMQIEINTGYKLTDIRKEDNRFRISFENGEEIYAQNVVLATGPAHDIWRIACHLGHTISKPVPSLFTFRSLEKRFVELAGISMNCRVSVPVFKLDAEGPLLITHRGFSGPVILRLSAWGARYFSDVNYQFEIHIAWLQPESVLSYITLMRKTQGGKQIRVTPPPAMARRLWDVIAEESGRTLWSDLTKSELHQIEQQLTDTRIFICGKDTFKDEFVTAGGVSLAEIDFRNMESRKCKGLFFAGELLDIDAVTGGFNFQACWTEGFLIGQSFKESIRR